MTTSFEYDLRPDELRSRRNSKWSRYEGDVLPAWIAEMDYAPAPAVQAAVQKLAHSSDYGYPLRNGDRADLAVSTAFVSRMKERFGWEPALDLVQPVADLVQATFATILAFSEPGDGVYLNLPAYPPFHEAIRTTGRRMVVQRMRDTGTGYDIDQSALESSPEVGTRIILLCNPQNPTGHVFTRDELEAIGRIAVERDLVILSDEIHADLIFDGRPHIPIATLSPAIAARTVTITSATKSFNIPGMRCAVMHFGSEALRDRFLARVPRRLLGAPSVFGIDATVAAWTEGQPWLDNVVGHLTSVRDRLMARVRSDLSGVRCYTPESTYMAWLDCTELALDRSAFDFLHSNARIALSAGETFDPQCQQFVRLNFASSNAVVDEIVDRFAEAITKVR